jgi:4-hydroxybenzoyl-CoA thioesterase/acyl-CoA thioester hydrolase
MNQDFSIQRRVEFRDTDAAGIVHFSNFFVYMEQAEHAFLRSLGLGVVQSLDGQHYSWPRVNCSCNFRNSIRFEDLITIKLTVQRIGNSSVTYQHRFYRDDLLIAEGLMTTVCCVFETGKPPKSVSIPLIFVQALKPFVVQQPG